MSFKFQDWVLKSQDCLVHLPVNVNRGVLHTHAQNTRDLLVSGGEKCMSYLLTGISPTERANWKPSSQLSPEAAQCPHMETLSTEACVRAKSRQSSPTLCDLMDCSLPGSSVQGIFQARVLEWVAISFSRNLPNPGTEPGSPTLQADLLGAVGLAN